MKIMIIEDNDFLYKKIADALNQILDTPTLYRGISRTGSMITLFNLKKWMDQVDLVITCNYLPFDSDSYNIKPYAKEIVKIIKERIDADLKVCIYSSEDIENCNYDYFIKLNSDTSIYNSIQRVIDDMMGKNKKLFMNNLGQNSNLYEEDLEKFKEEKQRQKILK